MLIKIKILTARQRYKLSLQCFKGLPQPPNRQQLPQNIQIRPNQNRQPKLWQLHLLHSPKMTVMIRTPSRFSKTSLKFKSKNLRCFFRKNWPISANQSSKSWTTQWRAPRKSLRDNFRRLTPQWITCRLSCKIWQIVQRRLTPKYSWYKSNWPRMWNRWEKIYLVQ